MHGDQRPRPINQAPAAPAPTSRRTGAAFFVKRAALQVARPRFLARLVVRRDVGRFVVRRGLKIRPVDGVDEAQRRFDDRKMPRRAQRRRIPYSTARAARFFKNKSRFFKKSFRYVDAVMFFVQKKSL